MSKVGPKKDEEYSVGSRSYINQLHHFVNNKKRLQVLTLSDATPSIGKIHPFIKMTVTFRPLMEFNCPLGFRKILITMT